MHKVTIDIAGESVSAIFAVPESGTGPGVIVVQEWWGLVPHIADVVERFAEAGFVALAVDHYRGRVTTEPNEAQKLMMALDIEQVAVDLARAAEWLESRDEVAGAAIGVVGFCMGGGLALIGPTVSELITGAVAFYPAMPWSDYAPDWSRYRGKEALVHKAESDEESNGATIAAYAKAIEAAGGTASLIEYPGSVHAFFNDARPHVFQAEHAHLAWEYTLAFLRAD